MFELRKLGVCLLTVLITAGGDAEGKTVEELKRSGDLRGLVAKLSDPRAAVLRDAAAALPEVDGKVKDPATLNSVAARLIEVRMSDPWKSTREYSGRALMYALNRTKDQGVLNSSVSPLLDALDRGQVEVERRRYAAVALSVVAMRLERVDALRPRFTELVSSALQDSDEGVREYAGRALQHIQSALKEQEQRAVPAKSKQTSNSPIAKATFSVAAVLVDHLHNLVRKIKHQPTPLALLGRITAATKDRDERVREAADRAKRDIENELKTKKPVAPNEA